jgi:FkbM family methyltransferase
MIKGIFDEIIRQGDLVFDIGANIGKMTDFYLSLGARVIAVEPQSKCLEILASKYASNENVVIEPCAVGESECTATMAIYGVASTISTLVPEHYWQQGGPWANTPRDGTEIVRVTTLDALIAKYGKPRFIKVDVEGYEREALRGLSQSVDWLSFEFHPYFSEAAFECIDRICQVWQDSGTVATFNHVLGEALRYEGDWLTPFQMKLAIERLWKERGLTYFGNIYVKKGHNIGQQL